MTNWKFGSKKINILTLVIVYMGVAFPSLIQNGLYLKEE